MSGIWVFRNNGDDMWDTSAGEPEICYEKHFVLPCPFCGAEPAPLDENDHTSCTNISCGSTAYMHVDAWNNRVAVLDENRQLLNAVKASNAWLDRWATHVGSCVGGDSCTCGLTLVRFETREAITCAEGDWND